jgi:hypothetical protein
MESTSRYPVVLLAFNRPDLTAKVFKTIRAWKPRELHLVVDGPRPGNPLDEDLVAQVKKVISVVDWPCEVHEHFADSNMGLKARISSGLSRVFDQSEAAIILEDDCVPDPSFFSYCDELLHRYRETPEVGIIGGSSRLRGSRASTYSYDFSSDLRIWGWATWARTWTGFVDSGDLDASWSENEREEIVARFPTGPRRASMSRMLSQAAQLDSWALPFAVHFKRRGYLSTVPEVNLVENVGFGARSTHTTFEDYVAQLPSQPLPFPLRHPPVVMENPEVDRLESARDRSERWRYPLRHPVDTLGRFLRYGARRLRGS